MNKRRIALRSLVSCLFVLGLVLCAAPALADLCFNCGSGSSNGCQQCRSRSGKDTQQDRKICQDLGCKITGYSSCSTAANVKVCLAPRGRSFAAGEYFPYHGM